LADSLAEQSTYDEAVNLLKSLLERDPNHSKAYFALGKIAFQQDRYSDAADHLKKSVELDHDFGTASYLLGRAYMKLGQKTLADEAFDRFRQLSAREQAERKEGKKRLTPGPVAQESR
jgi:tetratricopeptide (TPR) repeat protein